MLQLMDEEYDSLIKIIKDVLGMTKGWNSIECKRYIEADYSDNSGICITPISIVGNSKSFQIKSYDDLYVSKELDSNCDKKDRDKIVDEIFKVLNCEIFHDIINRCIPLIDALITIKSVMSTDDDETKHNLYESGKFIYTKLWEYPFEEDEKEIFDWLCEQAAKGYGEKFNEVESVWGTSITEPKQVDAA